MLGIRPLERQSDLVVVRLLMPNLARAQLPLFDHSVEDTERHVEFEMITLPALASALSQWLQMLTTTAVATDQ